MTFERARWSAHLSLLFHEHPFVARPAPAAAAGFDWIDSWWPAHDEQAPWAAAMRAAGLRPACLNADGGDLARGERGFLNLAECRERSVALVRQAVELSASLDGRVVNVLVGRLVPDSPRRRQWAAAVHALRECAALAADHGVELVVENINLHDIPGYIVPTPVLPSTWSRPSAGTRSASCTTRTMRRAWASTPSLTRRVSST